MERTLPAHQTCRHTAYRLTCELFEQLIAESNGQCMSCSRPATATGAGRLVIDHDHNHGDWAVRGLICSSCNSIFIRSGAGPAWAQPYLTNPWFVRHLAAFGMTPDLPVEPARESYLRDFDGHIWFYEDGAWRWTWNKSPRLAWSDLFYKFGPTGLVPTSRSEWVNSRGYKAYARVRAWRDGAEIQ